MVGGIEYSGSQGTNDTITRQSTLMYINGQRKEKKKTSKRKERKKIVCQDQLLFSFSPSYIYIERGKAPPISRRHRGFLLLFKQREDQIETTNTPTVW